MPLAIAVTAIVFNTINGSINGIFLAEAWFYSSYVCLIAGGCLFGLGMGLNLSSDNRLLALRKPGESGYTLPRGGFFERVTSPNLLGEILEWWGFFIAAPSWASFSFSIWTMANLVPRARDHHHWSREYFADYPKNRKILLPYLW